MTHPNEDTLLQFVLQTLVESDSSDIKEHLTGCMDCRASVRRMREEVGRIGSVRIQVDVPSAPILPVFQDAPWRRWGWAAGLAAGFLLGILTAHLADGGRPETVPQRLVTRAASSPTSGFTPCRAQDLQTVIRR